MKTTEETSNNQPPTPNLQPPSIPGWFDWPHWAQETIATLKDGAIYVEVGCFLGKSTCAIARLIQQSGKKIALHAVDMFCLNEDNSEPALLALVDRSQPSPQGLRRFDRQFEANLKASGVRKVVKLVKKPSLDAAAEYGDDSVDVVFIDADHSYAAVRADIKAWWPKLKPGGVMAGHDIHTYDSVWRAVHDGLTELGLQKSDIKIYGDQNIWVVRKGGAK